MWRAIGDARTLPLAASDPSVPGDTPEGDASPLEVDGRAPAGDRPSELVSASVVGWSAGEAVGSGASATLSRAAAVRGGSAPAASAPDPSVPPASAPDAAARPATAPDPSAPPASAPDPSAPPASAPDAAARAAS